MGSTWAPTRLAGQLEEVGLATAWPTGRGHKPTRQTGCEEGQALQRGERTNLLQVWTEDPATEWPQLPTPRRENQNSKRNHPNLGAFEKCGSSTYNSSAADTTAWPLPSPSSLPPRQALCGGQKSQRRVPGPGFTVMLSRSLPCRFPATEDHSAVGGTALSPHF